MNNSLTPREIEILEFLSQGYAYKMANDKLGITEQTVKNHLLTIKLKLGAENTTHAVAIVLRAGIIQ